jgi:hypothetical protein
MPTYLTLTFEFPPRHWRRCRIERSPAIYGQVTGAKFTNASTHVIVGPFRLGLVWASPEVRS